MKKILYFLLLIPFIASAGEGPVTNTPLMYKVYFIQLGFSKTSNQSDCVYIFRSPNGNSGTAVDIASVNAGAAITSLAANNGTLSTGTYTHICGVVKNGFDVIGSTSIGCTNADIASGDKINVAFGGHTYLKDATAALASTTCTVSISDTPAPLTIPTVGEDIRTPEGVTMTTDTITFIKQLPASFTIPAGGAAPTFSLAFDVTNTLEMVSTPVTSDNTLPVVAVFIQPPMPSVTAGS